MQAKGKSTLIGNYEAEVHRVRNFIEPYHFRHHWHRHRLGTVADTSSVNRCRRYPYRCSYGSRRRGSQSVSHNLVTRILGGTADGLVTLPVVPPSFLGSVERRY